MRKLLYLFGIILIAGVISCKKNNPEPEPEPQPEPEPEPQVEVDVALTRIIVPVIAVNGDQLTIRGRIQNFKEGVVNSVEITWQVDQGPEHSASFNNLNLERMDYYDFQHPDIYTAATGEHTLKVKITKVNGQEGDSRPANNEIVKTLKVASNSVQHIVLYEEFTSSTCNPCYVFNTDYFNENFLRYNRGKYTLIKYQMNWPGNGDPYYTEEGGTRRAFYGVTGVPTLYIDGESGTYFDQARLQADLNEHYNMPGVFELNAYYTITPNNDVKVKVEGTPYIDGQYKLYIAVVEKETTGNATTNGEDRFFNVMMKMVPNANGEDLNVTDGTQFTKRLQASLNGTNIEEYDDLEVVVFVQDPATKFVYQSTTAELDPTQIDF